VGWGVLAAFGVLVGVGEGVELGRGVGLTWLDGLDSETLHDGQELASTLAEGGSGDCDAADAPLLAGEQAPIRAASARAAAMKATLPSGLNVFMSVPSWRFGMPGPAALAAGGVYGTAAALTTIGSPFSSQP
jgi:hypothetical protein